MTDAVETYEKLGQFYLGRPFDIETGAAGEGWFLYDSRDLVTHAVCVGMTGSGKTGLCVSLIEEAAIDGIPALIIDPKGDLSNLLLAFPRLRSEDFLPWVNPDEARRNNVTLEEFAGRQASLWAKGLEGSGQSGERIQRLVDSAEFAVYTPGSEAGLPVSILSSFKSPALEIRADSELLRDRVATTATSLLGLLKMDADPVRSREHILISNILEPAWSRGEDMDLASLIRMIQEPTFSRIGVMELESFFPARDRFSLAMSLNNLLAAPGFANWLAGAPLDIDRLLYTEKAKPRVSIFSISHLSDSERMFFVSLLLNETLGWMRTRSGATSLRAILYIDEIFGFLPPVGEPASKKPLLTMVKQARAFGLGVVLATQNPVDLDYKALSNAGTWFIGRLQTDRDRQRVLDGLEGASRAFDRKAMSGALSRLDKRVFMMHNVHESAPEFFQTRWALSYLAGPMSREQIKSLTASRRSEESTLPVSPSIPDPGAGAVATSAEGPPVLPSGINQVFLPVKAACPVGSRLHYEATVMGSARVLFAKKRQGLDHPKHVTLLARFTGGNIDWAVAEEMALENEDFERSPREDATYGVLPESAAREASFRSFERDLADHLARSCKLDLYRCPRLKETSVPGEDERDFRIRLAHRYHEARDAEVEKLRKKYEPRRDSLDERMRRASQAVQRQQDRAREQRIQTTISIGAAIFDTFLGRKKVSRTSLGRATTAARSASRMGKSAQEVSRAEESVEALQKQRAELEAEFEREIGALSERFDPEREPLEITSLKPLKRDIDVRFVALAWLPYWAGQDNVLIPAYGIGDQV